MNKWQSALVIVIALAILALVLSLTPQTQNILSGVWSVISFVGWHIIITPILGLLILGFGFLMGFLFKGYAIAWVDSKLEEGRDISTSFHWVIGILFGLIFGLIQLSLMYPVMSLNTWIRWLAMSLDWPGVYETPPVFWLFYGGLAFLWVYMKTKYQLEV